MKLRYKEKVGEYDIVRFVRDAVIDSQKTMKKIEALISPEMSEADIKRLFNDNLEFAQPGGEADLIEDAEGEQTSEMLAAMDSNKRLLTSLEYIDDHRGVEYWHKPAGTWLKETVEEIGVALPSDAIKQENLDSEQQLEIREQQEAERFAALTPKQQAEETKRKVEAQLAALDREYLTPRILAGLALGDSHAIEQAQIHERLAIPLRAEWQEQKEQLAVLLV